MKRRIVISTVGYHARETFRRLKIDSSAEVICFTDNDNQLWGDQIFGYPIVDPREINRYEFDVVAVPGRHQSDIIKQLQDFGVPHSKIWRVSKSEIRQTKAALSRRAELLNAILNPAIQLLNDNTIPYFATNSFLLSIVRGDHPASFADLDILYEINYGETIKNEMISRFPSEDITIIQDNTDESVKKMIIQKGSLVDPICDPAVIDLHPLTMGSDFAFWTANQRVKKIPIHFFKTQKFQHVNGLDISIPNNAEDLLTLYYGNDWQEPHEYWDGIFDFERNTLF